MYGHILVPRAHDPSAGRDRELWPVPKYAQSQWRCIFVTDGNHCCFRLLSLRRRAGSPWFTDFLGWKQPELSIPAAGQKDRGLWGREWCGHGYRAFSTPAQVQWCGANRVNERNMLRHGSFITRTKEMLADVGSKVWLNSNFKRSMCQQMPHGAQTIATCCT